MAPSPGGRGPAEGAPGHDRSARSLRALAEEAERDRSDPEELARLLASVAAGDVQALQRVFNENLAMVLRRAHELAGGGGAQLNEDELVQEGSLALLDAIRTSAAEDGGVGRAQRLPVDAEAAVEDRMRQALDQQASVASAQRQLLEDAETYERAEISIRREMKRDATNAELAEKLEWSPEKTRLLGEMVAEARRQHDEDLLHYVDPEELSEAGDE